MQFIFKLVVLSLLVLVVTNYIAYQKSGNIPAREWLSDAQNAFNKVVHKDAASEVKRVAVSKWTDAHGVVHYENRPVDGATTIEVDPNANLLPPMPSVNLPNNTDAKAKTMKEELRDMQEAKKAHFDALTQ